MDWIPALVTSCWVHETPLMDWPDCESAGRRRLPKAWLYKTYDKDQALPAFMRPQLETIRQLKRNDAALAEEGASLPVVLSWLRRAQVVGEKRFDTPIPEYAQVRTIEKDLRSDLRLLIEFASRHQDRHREPPLADSARPDQWPAWFGPLPDSAQRREWKFSDNGIRQDGCVRWRRSYLFFAVRTLAGTERYGAFIAGTPSNVSGWMEWWDELKGRLGPEQKDALDWHRKVSMRDLGC